MTRPEAVGDDPLTGRPLRFGPTGFELAGTPSELGPAADAFGHTGAGGSSHGAWPAAATGFSFVTAELRTEEGDGRAAALLAALHEAWSADARRTSCFVMADQLRGLGAARPTAIRLRRTPHIAALAAEGDGVRECLLRLAAVRAVAGRDADRPAARPRPASTTTRPSCRHRSPPSPTSLRAAGYAPPLAGKMHFVGPDQLHGFEERLTTDVYPAGFDWTPDWRLPTGEPAALVPQHGQHAGWRACTRRRCRRTTTTRSAFRSVQRLRDRLARAALAAVLPHRLVHEPARSLGGSPPPLGPVRRASTWGGRRWT